MDAGPERSLKTLIYSDKIINHLNIGGINDETIY